MISYKAVSYTASRKQFYLLVFLLFVLLASLAGIPTWIAFRSWPYPNLDLLLFFYALIPLLWVALLVDFGSRASSIEFHEDGFSVKKIAQKTNWHLYADILTYSERLGSKQNEPSPELRVYLSDNWFLIRPSDFINYDSLRDKFTQYGQPGPVRKVLTLTERNRFRWAIGAFALIIGLNMLFAYLAHTPVDKAPAKLKSVTAIVDRISTNSTKGIFKGFTLKLHPWPDLEFIVSRRDFDTDIRSLKQLIAVNQPITVQLRESDFRKKLTQTESLSFGDKYDNYAQIRVFSIDQGKLVQLQSTNPIYESRHTNLLLRTILLSFLLLFCWVGWVFVDSYKVLRPN
ncbi:hypothetical protein [Spirosoma foliorum]|uniref:Uncharacterized protein n=1 Tax=Spirosoma foliorum TaxID=2710596 RepID=A0A7G5GZX9_9BACT|nr:hypothetical protein [Spirosoma foliorum]QMW04421.1 hypothetical protein H3H32_05620 [Spirosoma foliorum]